MNQFDVQNGILLATSCDVDDFHDGMKVAMMEGFVLYSPMVVTSRRDGEQEIGQYVMRGPSSLTYMLIVAESLEEFADRLMKVCEAGWDVLFWYVQMDGKYLQWVSKPVDPKFSFGKVLTDVLTEAVDEFNELEKPRAHWVKAPNVVTFDGVFVKSIQKMDLVARDQ